MNFSGLGVPIYLNLCLFSIFLGELIHMPERQIFCNVFVSVVNRGLLLINLKEKTCKK